jgi:predicted DNA-binding protein (MmcQ/YjbR family)
MMQLREYALSLPSAWEDHPWGETVFKVGKKVFVFSGRPEESAGGVRMAVKLLDSGQALLGRPGFSPTGYGLGKAGWVSVDLPGEQAPSLDVAKAWIAESYRNVAPKRLGKLVR